MKIKFIILSLFVTFCSYSQLDKKTWLVGGTGSFNSYKRDESFILPNTGEYVKIRWDIKDFEFSPKVGLFIIDKLAVGLSSSFTREKSESTTITGNASGASSNSYRFSVGPFVRYYFLNKDKNFNFLVETNYQFGKVMVTDLPKDKGSINRFTFLAGPELFFNSAVGMEVLLGYKVYNETIDNPYASSIKENGFQLAIGFQIHLEKL